MVKEKKVFDEVEFKEKILKLYIKDWLNQRITEFVRMVEPDTKLERLRNSDARGVVIELLEEAFKEILEEWDPGATVEAEEQIEKIALKHGLVGSDAKKWAKLATGKD